jgi:hypothetical protein
MWDLRRPAGLFFSGLGLILCMVGLVYPENRAPLTDANVNLYTGAGICAFGGVMLWLSRRPS